MIDTREIATAKIVMLGGNGGGGGTSNYNQLTNKPSINGVTLQGNKTSADLNISGMPENPLATSHGGTGNADGYIRKGVAQGSTVGNGSTAEGYGNTVSGDYSHAEGSGNTASSYHAHAEGSTNTASAPQAHAEGYGTTASGAHSHAGGAYTVAGYANQTAIGEYNDNKATTLLEVGNGTADSARSNAFEVHSNGNIVAGGTVSDANGTLNAVVGNPSDTVSSIIDKIKIGARTYDTSAIKPYTATNITTSAISIFIGLAEASTLNGRIIAVNTGSRSGTPSNAWGLNILYNGGGSSVGCAILKSDGTTFKDAVTANEVLFLSMDMTNLEATIVNIAGTSGGGATSLAGLSDTAITTPTNGQILKYNSTTGKWENADESISITYNIKSKSTGGTDAAITIKKYTNGALDWSRDYVYTDLLNAMVNIDDYFNITYNLNTGYTYTLLKASANHSVGYNYTWSYSTSVDITETFEVTNTDLVSNSVVGTVENGTTATQAYAVGEHFIRNDKFCTCISAIASGATLTQGTNYVEGSISQAIARMGTYSTDEVEIGTWLGKRLYRRTFDVGSLTLYSGSWNQSNIPSTDKTALISVLGMNSTGTYFCLHGSCDGASYCAFMVTRSDGQAASVKYITLEYTKD